MEKSLGAKCELALKAWLTCLALLGIVMGKRQTRLAYLVLCYGFKHFWGSYGYSFWWSRFNFSSSLK
jgi:apolipoprotein N-acyltransferase